MERDLQLTGAVQNLLLPQEDTWVEGSLRLCAYYEPMSRAGGDYWFARRLADGTLRILLADVTGHGAGASMVTAAVAGCERALTRDAGSAPDAQELLAAVHRVLEEICRGAYTMPACLLEVSPDGECRCWSAAAPPLLVQRANGDFEVKGAKGHPLGSDELLFGEVQWQLGPGDRMLAFTDGVVELELPSGRDMGLKRLKTFMENCEGKDLQQTRAAIIEQVREAQDGKPAGDDITYLLLERAAD